MVSVLAAYIATVLIFLILPSPIDIVVMNGANRYGFKGAFCTVMATNAASLVWIAAAGVMLAGLGAVNESFLDILSGVGGIYLIYYGYGLWKNAGHTVTESSFQTKAAPQSLRQMMASAFAVGISSPKDIIFFMTFFPPFIGQLDFGLIRSLMVLTLIWCILDYVVLIAYGIGLAKLITPKREVFIYRVSAFIFWAIGLYAAWTGVGVYLSFK